MKMPKTLKRQQKKPNRKQVGQNNVTGEDSLEILTLKQHLVQCCKINPLLENDNGRSKRCSSGLWLIQQYMLAPHISQVSNSVDGRTCRRAHSLLYRLYCLIPPASILERFLRVAPSCTDLLLF